MIELSVGRIREELVKVSATEDRGAGQPSTLLLGRLFHEVCAELVRPDSGSLQVIADSGPSRDRRIEVLEEHTWRRLVAPRLLRHAALLQGSSERVVMLWQAVRNVNSWLVDIVVELLEQSEEARAQSHLLAEHLRAEVPLECEFREAGWTEPVRVVGIADSLIRVPTKDTYCTIEFKLGRSHPAADLGQVALYHLLLQRSQKIAANSVIGLVRFSPERDERLLEPQAFGQAQAELLSLIGALAGVLPKSSSTPEKARTKRETPRAASAEAKRAADEPAAATPRTKDTIAEPAAPAPAPKEDTGAQPAVEPAAPARGAEPAPGAEVYTKLGEGLRRAFKEYGARLELRGEPSVGPRFLRFEVRLATGTRVAKVHTYTREVQHRLGLAQEPMIAHDSGRIYLDVARPDPQTVLFSSILDQLPKGDALRGSSRVPIGVDAAGKLHFVDVGASGLSHMLVAGSSGSGKSEWLRTAIAGLIASNTPETLRLVTLDPKLAAFNDLEKSRFLWKSDSWWIPQSEGRGASEVFDELITEMNRRYELTRQVGADNLPEYVEKTGKPMPRIVCVCDEYFALVSESRDQKKHIEQAVSLLGAKARAAGINLILATQQPSRATISGAIQANLQCRVALTLTSPIESNMILGESGAERLTLRGDLLYKDFGNPVRLQAPYLPEAERLRWLRG